MTVTFPRTPIIIAMNLTKDIIINEHVQKILFEIVWKTVVLFAMVVNWFVE